MKIEQAKMGLLVEHDLEFKKKSALRMPRFGFIVGIAENTFREPTLKVAWQDGDETAVHPHNLTLANET